MKGDDVRDFVGFQRPPAATPGLSPFAFSTGLSKSSPGYLPKQKTGSGFFQWMMKSEVLADHPITIEKATSLFVSV
jgi:hypothetical protein